MKLKLDDKGNAVLQDGHPVYIHDNGTEAPFDAKAAHIQIATLSREAGERRPALKVAEEKLAAFGDLDPAAALKATAFAASLEGKKVLDDEGLQKVIGAALKPVQDKLAAAESALAAGEVVGRTEDRGGGGTEVAMHARGVRRRGGGEGRILAERRKQKRENENDRRSGGERRAAAHHQEGKQ